MRSYKATSARNKIGHSGHEIYFPRDRLIDPAQFRPPSLLICGEDTAAHAQSQHSVWYGHVTLPGGFPDGFRAPESRDQNAGIRPIPPNPPTPPNPPPS